MIPSLYPKFQEWSEGGSIYIISDTHFDDFDCKYMDPNWIEPQEHINIIKQKVHKPDTLIHLGDVGNGEWLRQISARRKILITGNHDKLSEVSKYFNEIYDGPLFIGDRILLSHEPIMGLSFMCWNIHGHDHGDTHRTSHTNLAANVYHYQVFNLGEEIKNGLLKDVENYHRSTINEATLRKDKVEEYSKYFGNDYAKKLDDLIHRQKEERNYQIIEQLSTPLSTPDPCKGCSNHPSNGGSGICHCTLGLKNFY